MPFIVPRRRMIAASAALPLLLTVCGCRSEDVFTGPDPLAGPAPLGHDVVTLEAVIVAEEKLVSLYRMAIVQPGGRGHDLPRLLAEHEQHRARLRARLIEPPGTAATHPPARPAASRSPGAAAQAHPPVTARRLRAAEHASAAGLVPQLADVGPSLAQLFASIAACHATHVTALGG